MKKIKDKAFQKNYINYKKYLIFFPLEIYSEKEYKETLEKSLFFDFKSDIKDFKTEKKILKDLNKIKIANLVLSIEN